MRECLKIPRGEALGTAAMSTFAAESCSLNLQSLIHRWTLTDIVLHVEVGLALISLETEGYLTNGSVDEGSLHRNFRCCQEGPRAERESGSAKDNLKRKVLGWLEKNYQHAPSATVWRQGHINGELEKVMAAASNHRSILLMVDCLGF